MRLTRRGDGTMEKSHIVNCTSDTSEIHIRVSLDDVRDRYVVGRGVFQGFPLKAI